MHNKQFQQPRRSHFGVAVTDLASADFTFLGRAGDALTFSVQTPAVPAPPPVLGDTSLPGFRYDLKTDRAVVLPQVATPPTAPPAYYGLPAYPYFVYHAPGARIVPLSPFSPALTVAAALRTHCRFEAALKWYRLAFDPLTQYCTWIHCGPTPPPTPPSGPNTPEVKKPATVADVAIRGGQPNVACCDSDDVSCDAARQRSVLLHYLEALRDYGEAVMRRNSPEAFQHARLIFETAQRILGKRPHSVKLPEPAAPPTIGSFQPYYAPLNPRLMDLYDVIRDRLGLIHACQTSRRLRDGRPNCDMPYFGDDPLREGWRSNAEACAQDGAWCCLHSPYRFTFLSQKAQELTARVRELSGQLLSAVEKGDAEYLAAMRAGQEREILALVLDARKDQWRDADWQIEALQKTKAVNQANLKYYNGLIQNSLINDEIDYQDLTIASTVLRAAGDISEAVATGIGAIPNMYTGAAGFGGSPVFLLQLPVGTPLAMIFSTIARIMASLAEIATSTAGLQLTEGSWQRRNDEWVHQTQILTIEIEQIEQQILGAQRRRDQALHELNSHNRQMENSTQVENFLRDKFTSHELYLFQQKEAAALCCQMYDLSLHAARQAERAFNFERGHKTRRFVPECAWDSLQEGLMAGERLDLALRHMEKAYLDENLREYELTKHFSLRLHFPLAYLRLRITGCCEIELPEWMFDLDFPGQYMRRVKNVTVTIPCVTGPYTGVHCRLTLLSSRTRIDPRLIPAADGCCCCESKPRSDYEACPHDPRMVKQFAAREAIATSSGQNDSGLFELNFRDERYLPFEFLGAVSRWRIELPPENNYFDMDTLSDLILNLNYTAREGGELLRRAANESAQRHLPGAGVRFFDVRHEFPDAWQLFQGASAHKKGPSELGLRLGRGLFPFLPGRREVTINRLDLFFQAPCAEPGSHRVIEFALVQRNGSECAARSIVCTASADWQGLYHASLDVRRPLTRQVEHIGTLRFPHDMGPVDHAYLLCCWASDRPDAGC